MKLVMVIAFEGFRDEEYDIPRKIFDANGVDVDVASYQVGEATGKFGMKVKVDLNYLDIDMDSYDALVLIGGPGTTYYLDDEPMQQIASDFLEEYKLVGAICMAPVILANAGLLEDKKATVFEGNVEDIKQMGAIYTGNNVEQVDNLLTACGPQAAEEFGQKIVQYLK